MRTLRAVAVAGIAAATLVLAPIGASADGGAYISFEETHYLPGETAVGEGYVYVPKKHQDLLERGPFYGYLVKGDPDGGDLPLGAFEVERYAAEEFELHLSFVVPDVAGDYYTVRVCNDPCTISGFREPLTGTISIVRTEREAELLNENTKLGYRNYALARKLRKTERQLDELREATATAEAGTSTIAESSDEPLAPSPVSHDVAIPASSSREASRPLVDAWALFGLGGGALVVVFGIGLAIVFSRRDVTNAQGDPRVSD